MKLFLINHSCKYECEKICRIFFPAECFEFIPEKEEKTDEDYVYTEITENGDSLTFYAEVLINGKRADFSETVSSDAATDDSTKEKYLARSMVRALAAVTGFVPPWGILTGVRPSKLMQKHIGEKGEEKADTIFNGFLMVSPEKTRLAHSVATAEQKCIGLSERSSYSVYVSIPFCPTRCSYCSFVSHSIAQAKKLIPDYVRLLCEEIEYSAQLAAEAGLKVDTVYIGGGTPTSLEAADLEKICDALNAHFGARLCREFTVEAGRPDTITKEKLEVLKKAGVTRISINPQTFSDEVLHNIGRKHSAQDTIDKFNLARSLGFDNINMDFIAGLPGDSVENFRASIEKAIALGAENITVHTLALKKSASLVTEDETGTVCDETPGMLGIASQLLYGAGYIPYYMYRQSKSVGNLENVGWCRQGRECLYNIYMMEEIHSIMAMGGGAVTKLVDPDTKQIERVYNFKYPYEYISRFAELLERKRSMNIPR